MNVPKAALVPAALLLVALLPLPYGYYTFLRLIVTGWAVFLIWFEYQGRSELNGWAIGFALIAALFNPIVPVHLDREVWRIIDFVAAVVFGVYATRGLKGA